MAINGDDHDHDNGADNDDSPSPNLDVKNNNHILVFFKTSVKINRSVKASL